MEGLGGRDVVHPSSAEHEIDLDPLGQGPPPVREGVGKRVEQTRAQIAYLLIGLLAGITASLLALLWQHRLSVEELSSIAGVLISPIVGLLGAATGYYYARGDR